MIQWGTHWDGELANSEFPPFVHEKSNSDRVIEYKLQIKHSHIHPNAAARSQFGYAAHL
jgi:hypothetical protein